MSLPLRPACFPSLAAQLALIAVVLLPPSVTGQTTRRSGGSLRGNVQIGNGNVLRSGGDLRGNVQIGNGNVQFGGGGNYQATRQIAASHKSNSPVRVATWNGDVILRKTDRQDVQITAQLRAGSQARLNAIQLAAARDKGGSLSISVKWPGGKPLSNDRCSFEILIPDARGVRAETGNGQLVIDGLAGPIAATTENGAIRIVSVEGDVDAHSGNQGIEITDVSGSVKARTGNGKIQVVRAQGNVEVQSGNQGIEVTDAGGSVKAKTANGEIRINLADDSPGPLEVRTDNGPITLELGGAFAGQIELNVPWGPIDVDLPGAQVVSSDKRSKTLRIGNGNQKSTARTTNGGIHVRRRTSTAKTTRSSQ